MLIPTRHLRASWSNTLRLPKSIFPARPLPTTHAEYLRRCTEDLYAWQQNARSRPDGEGKTTQAFILHDGPPYANGPLHVGHALNKITKDLICRFQLGQGKRVNYIPGWDCHGLPIEIKALQAQNQDAAADPVSVREAARKLATRTVEEQMKGFKEWAIMGDWDNAYRTMERGYEIRQLKVFKTMFEKGLIYRQCKPVYWSPSSRTALAEAELEYDDNHKSLAAFVCLPVTISEELKKGTLASVSEPLHVAIWTTTPWTLPANKAIAVHKDMEYSIIRDPENGNELVLIATSRIAHYQEMLGHEVDILPTTLLGSDLAGTISYENPFQRANGLQPVIHADFVTDSSGTGLVHCAPGHGMDDYHVCQALSIDAFAPIDDAGAFTVDAFPEHPEILKGLLVSDEKRSGSNAVINFLRGQNMLRVKHTYRHKYPMDWRTKQPVVVRATEQWFANVDNIKQGSTRALERADFIPETGRARLESFIQGRSQWCISRQRAWGVPIPALYRAENGKLEAVMDAEVIQHIINVIDQRGINAWWTDEVDDPAWKPQHLTGTYSRGRDTMDVWFDSGTSWTLLHPRSDQPMADVYLEGTDQHRGWFQSSLLTYISTQEYNSDATKAPYKTLITHGFTLDAEGRKMSKSLGNVISPHQIMSGQLLPPIKRKKQKATAQEKVKAETPTFDSMGPDALRLWVASSDYTRDVTIGQPILISVNQALHKYRVTFKWLLGIFSLESCPPAFTSFNELRAQVAENPFQFALLSDKLAMRRLTQVSEEVHQSFVKYEFFKGVNAINKYIANDLSAFYFETLKDRIYTGTKTDCQQLQNVLGAIFYELLQILAPINPLLVEEVWDYVPEALKRGSVHPAKATWKPLQPLPQGHFETEKFVNEQMPHQLDAYIEYSKTVGVAIKAAQERLRAEKKMGSSLECHVTIALSEDVTAPLLDQFLRGNPSHQLKRFEELAGLFVVSSVELVDEAEQRIFKDELLNDNEPFAEEAFEIEGVKGKVLVSKPLDHKCPRCWRYVTIEPETLCKRCDDVVNQDIM